MTLYDSTNTPLSKTAAVALTSADPDPLVVVNASMYEGSQYDGMPNFPEPERQIAFAAGQVVRRSAIENYYKAATVDTVAPTGGTTSGGTDVTIHGTNFTPGSTVTFGGTAATSVVVVNATTITCKSPAKTAGAVAVQVTTGYGAVSKASAFTYS